MVTRWMPGSVNARVLSFMANHPQVRKRLSENGIHIPEDVQFMGGLHDTTNDELSFYDENFLSAENAALHKKNKKYFNKALDDNAKERSRRFILTNTKQSAARVHTQVKLRSVSLFEPRTEPCHQCLMHRWKKKTDKEPLFRPPVIYEFLQL